jgi:membrane glycosyltransferase
VDEIMSDVAVGQAPAIVSRDASDPALLPAEARLPMPEQDFSLRIPIVPEPRRRTYWVPRAAVFAGAFLVTVAFGMELLDVLSFVRMTPIQLVFLVLSTVSFGWMALGSLSAAMGFLPLFAGDRADTVHAPQPDGAMHEHTALLFPVYHEDPAQIAGTIAAVADELSELGRAGNFAVFVLSDTRGDAAGKAEERVYAALAQELDGKIEVYYRRRRENAARKAGNIKDWIERFGAGYAHFVILDADSVMSGVTLVRLALAMESEPHSGLIQTVPKLIGGTTLLQRLQQYASNIYGPAVASGIAFWHRDQGNYWGHNAIIRTVAFASAAGLPHLPGKPPFGGAVQSHDFVEAVLLQRAGWGVHMLPTLGGSFEGLPPTLVDLVVRDRRWAQGNLQHLAIVGKAGLTPMGRLHLAMGAFAYIVSGIWAASLAVGLVLALQGQQMIPSYFQDSKTLFPIWPIIDPGAALRLFLATIAVVLLPKVLGLLLELKRLRSAREVGGSVRAVLGTLVETIFSMLIAPILMITQTVAVVQILLGFDSGWKAQRRGATVSAADAARFHWRHMLVGVAMTLVCWYASPPLVAWMAPVLAGLVLSAPLSWLLGREPLRIVSRLLSTPEERMPPAIVTRANAAAGEWTKRMPELAETSGGAPLPKAA